MAYYTRSKFNFAQNILTVQRPGRIPFTIVFAQFFHKFNQPKLTSYWLYRCPTAHPLSPTQICMITACNFSWVLQSSQEKSKTIRQWLCNFFWCGGGGVGGGGETRCIVVFMKMVNCWVFVFLPFCHSAKDHVVITRVAVGVASWLDQSRINFFYDDSDKYYTLFTVAWLMTLLKLFQDRMAFSLVVVYLFLAQNTIF